MTFSTIRARCAGTFIEATWRSAVIHNDQELAVTKERVSYFLDLLARLRVSSRPEDLALVTGGYRAEVERMQREVLDYLTRPAERSAKAG